MCKIFKTQSKKGIPEWSRKFTAGNNRLFCC